MDLAGLLCARWCDPAQLPRALEGARTSIFVDPFLGAAHQLLRDGLRAGIAGRVKSTRSVMKRMAVSLTCALLVAFALSAQTPAKGPAKSSGLGKSEAASNEDLNIRAYIQLLRSDVRKQASQIMGDVMQLDTDQATKFWPIYKEFETEQGRIGDQIVALLKNYAQNYNQMTGQVADQLVNQLFAIEQQRTELKKKYYGQFKQALDPVTAARFVQVENQLEKLMDLQIAAGLPVVGAQ
jgi:hypothetical protein